MGLKDVVDEHDTNRHPGRHFKDHEYDDKVWEMIEDAQEWFPEEIQVEFVEYSPSMEKHYAKAYKKTDHGSNKYDNPRYYQYIRYSDLFKGQERKAQEMMIRHEMLHLYLYQTNRSHLTEHSDKFAYLLGMLQSHISGTYPKEKFYTNVMKEFAESTDSMFHYDE